MTDVAGKRIVGYCDPLSVSPGDTVAFMISSLDGEPFDARLVRLVCGDVSPDGHGFEEREVPCAIDGSYDGVAQPIRRGSYVEIAADPFLATLAAVVIRVAVWPTLPDAGRQVIMASHDDRGGFALAIDREGRVVFEVGPAHSPIVVRGPRLPARRWTVLCAEADPHAGVVRVGGQRVAVPVPERADRLSWTTELKADAARLASSGLLLLGAELDADGHTRHPFNGRLDDCTLASAPGREPEVVWDFALGIDTTAVVDTGRYGLHGRTVQLPTRAVPGVRWTGAVHDWRQDPRHYSAIHFHADDLNDAGWRPSVVFDVPRDLGSGVYALRVRTVSSEDYVPFFVLPSPTAPPAPIGFLAPTMTYRAYANIRLNATPDRLFGNGAAMEMPNERFLLAHPECGLGTYDTHRDGSGVMFSSHRRPVLNLKPKGGVWSFTADTNVTAWLEHAGAAFDVLTDDALHARGLALLERYRVIVTGTHPEYWTTPMLDALEAYLARGGRLMYLGANGFYWRAALHPATSGTVEVRRAEDGTRAWIAEPGEYHHASTGELGGLWRRIGRPPNRLVGVGFAAQGFSRSAPYRRASGWNDPRVAFAVAGCSTSQTLGDHGSVGGGAAGHELDRFDPTLGSPSHAVVLASADELPSDMLLTKEELFATGVPGRPVRADVVFFECPHGGAVFSVGSIAWAASLATNGYDNDVARLTTNVLRRFADRTPIPSPEAEGSS